LDIYRMGDDSGVVEREDAKMRWGTAVEEVEEDEGPTENEKWYGFCGGEYPEEGMAEAAIGAIIEEFERLHGGPDNCPYGVKLDREEKTVVLWKHTR
jgi:hypothetical protein